MVSQYQITPLLTHNLPTRRFLFLISPVLLLYRSSGLPYLKLSIRCLDRDIKYFVRDIKYFVRDIKYFVRDIKYFVRDIK